MKTKYSGVYVDNDGRYTVRLDLGRDSATGKRIQKVTRKNVLGKTFKTGKEAFLEATRIRRELQINKGYADYDLTYSEFVSEKFIPAYKSLVQNDTFLSRRPALKLISKRFAEIKLNNLRFAEAEGFRIWLINESGFSQSYASGVYGLFRHSMDYAVQLGLVSENISRKTRAIPKGKTHIKIWNKEDFEKVMSQIPRGMNLYEDMCFVMIWLYYMTGMRVSEGLALTWNDVDLNRGKIVIAHTLHMKNKNNFTVVDQTKTVNGMRTISIDPKTVNFLRDWKQRQSEFGIDKFILSYDGGPLFRSTVMRIIRRYAKKAGVQPIQGKELRHSHVSYLINELNADVLTISRRLGHSGPDITLKYYAHMWNRNDEGLINDMANGIDIDNSQAKPLDFSGNQFLRMNSYNSPTI